MAKYKVTDGEEVRARYDTLEAAIQAADRAGQGFKVVSGTSTIYEQQTAAKRLKKADSKVLSVAKEMAAGMKAVGKFRYYNSNVSGTYDTAMGLRNYRCNCATLPNWIFRRLKITHGGEYFYGRAGGDIAWNDATKASIKTMCDVFRVDMTVEKALDKGVLQPGDVCCYGEQHTNIYAGGTKWYEAGTVYADGSSRDGTPLKKFYGGTVLTGAVISWVIRYNDLAYTPAKREYRVQCGSFTKKSNAKELKKKIRAKNIPAIVVTVGKQYVVQIGRFTCLGNAVRMAEQMTLLNFPTMITGV